MESRLREELRLQLVELLREQAELEARTLGIASEEEILGYDLRQDVIRDLCNQLANSRAA